MSQQEQHVLFDGWARVHTAPAPQPSMHVSAPQPVCHVSESAVWPQLSVSYLPLQLDLAISKRPAALLDVFSPTGRPVGDNYFRIYPLVRFRPSEIVRVVLHLWLHAAMIRYCEVWQSFPVNKFVRGYQGTALLRVWIDQVLRGEGKRADRALLTQRADMRWELAHAQAAYPHIRRWSSQAIAAARTFAWKYNSQKR